jgi:Flp pilus assembly pilin Flp
LWDAEDVSLLKSRKRAMKIKQSTRAAATVEYGLLVGLIAVGAISTAAFAGGRIGDLFADPGAALSASLAVEAVDTPAPSPTMFSSDFVFAFAQSDPFSLITDMVIVPAGTGVNPGDTIRPTTMGIEAFSGISDPAALCSAADPFSFHPRNTSTSAAFPLLPHGLSEVVATVETMTISATTHPDFEWLSVGGLTVIETAGEYNYSPASIDLLRNLGPVEIVVGLSCSRSLAGM